jgi:hemerythrin-like domain-containing protein
MWCHTIDPALNFPREIRELRLSKRRSKDMQQTDQLTQEHNQIKRLLQVALVVCDRITRGEILPAEHLAAIVTFIRRYADAYHHAKEEDLLFPAMEAAGVSKEGGPIGVMLVEHVQGRAYATNMEGAVEEIRGGQSQAAEAFVANLRAYGELLVPHIFKEDNILYPMADERLTPEQQDRLAEQFEQVNREWSEEVESLLRSLDELTTAYPG